jgi:predicted small lipoprotein YifL
MKTVLRSGWLVVVAFVAALAACGGGGGNTSPPPAALQLDSPKGVTQTVGAAGGSLTATATDGTRYTLTVPAQALRQDVAITLTPIAALGDLPPGVSLAGGAQLGPEGQTFDVPITLTVELATSPASAPVPFAYAGDLQQRHLYPAAVAGRTITFDLAHFSGYAALIGQLELIGGPTGYIPPPSSGGEQALQALVNLSLQPPSATRIPGMLTALRGWLDNTIKPAVAAAQAVTSIDVDPAGNTSALTKVSALHNDLTVFSIALKYAVLSGVGSGDLAGIQTDYRIAVRDSAQHAIPRFNAACSQFSSAWFLAVPGVFAWQQLAQGSGAADIEPALERAAVLQALCIQVAYDPNGGVDFPTCLQPGQTGTLSVRAGYSINGGPVRFDQPTRVSTFGTNTSTDPLVGANEPVAAGATYSQQFLWEPATTEMRIDIDVCLAGVLLEALREVCQPAAVVRGTPASSCPLYRVDVRGESNTSRNFFVNATAGFSQPGAYGAATLGSNLTLSLTSAYAGTSTAHGTLVYHVDASRASGSSFDVVWQWSGSSNIHLGGSCTASLTVGGVTRSFTAATTDPNGTSFGQHDFTLPMTVRHGDVLAVRLDAACTSPGMLVNSNVGLVMHLPSGEVRFDPVTCGDGVQR